MKMNNKGFAISTLIYGLSIMGMMLVAILMGIVAVNRSNNRILSSEVDEDLTRFSKTDSTFKTAGTEQEFVVPTGEAGWYKIELWGAAGNGGTGGRGAYTSGIIELEEGQRIYFNIGSKSVQNQNSTDVRLVSKSDGDADSTYSRIMVAAGGGKLATAHGGTLVGYSSGLQPQDGKLNMDTDYSLTTGSKTLVGYASYSEPGSASFISNPTSISTGNGGSGFFSSQAEGVGGTSYIAGYAGCQGITKTNALSSTIIGVERTETDWDDDGEEILVDKIYRFYDGMMIAGVNSGDGRAKIERVVRKTAEDQKLVRSNTKLNGVTKITDCVTGSTDTAANRIVAIKDGVNYAGALSTSGKCASVSITGGAKDLDEIAVWHGGGKDYSGNTITVDTTSGNGKELKKASSTGISETETATGYRISAYQPDMTGYLPPSGNYYIMSVLSENKALTAQPDADASHQPIMMSYISGNKTQKWSVELITNTRISKDYVAGNTSTYEYKILELARFRALNILADDNAEKAEIGAAIEFNNTGRNDIAIWTVIPMGDGTYVIKTVRNVFKSGVDTGNIFPDFSNSLKPILIGVNNNTTERFKLISIDYSSA